MVAGVTSAEDVPLSRPSMVNLAIVGSNLCGFRYILLKLLDNWSVNWQKSSLLLLYIDVMVESETGFSGVLGSALGSESSGWLELVLNELMSLPL